MIRVDAAGLVSAAQRVADVLAELSGGDPAHPALGADPASAGAALRLSSAGAALVEVIAQQALGLTATAAQLLNVSTTFEVQDLYNKSGIEKLGVPDLITVTGWAPPSPPIPPDIRPPLPAPPPVPGEALATAVHTGDPRAGEPFIAAWRELVSRLEGAADTVRAVAGQVPDVWDSPVATDTVREHLYRYAQAFDTSAARAQTLSWQADQHAAQNAQARSDIPTPQQYAELRQQIQRVAAANAASGGRYAAQLAALMSEMTGLDSRTLAGYSGLHTETDRTTAGDGCQDAGAATGTGGPAGTAQSGGNPASPDKAGQLASMLPQVLQSVMGAAGGLFGGALQMPQQMMQAGSQVAQQLGQQLGGLMKPDGRDAALEKTSRAIDPGKGAGLGAGGAGGGIPGGGAGAGSTSPQVTPSTGPPPKLPTMPAGGLPPSVTPAAASSGAMPMGMPLGGLAGAAGHGAEGAGGQEPKSRTKKLVTPPEPHTESVTGRVNADRIAMSAGADSGSEPPDDEPPSHSPTPVVRRITIARRDDDS